VQTDPAGVEFMGLLKERVELEHRRTLEDLIVMASMRKNDT